MMITFANLLLMVRNDAAYKVGIRVVQRLHQFAQLFLVRLSNSSEHSLASCRSAGAKWTGLCHCSRHPNNIRYKHTRQYVYTQFGSIQKFVQHISYGLSSQDSTGP